MPDGLNKITDPAAVISLREYLDSPVDLATDDLDFLAANFGNRIAIRRSPSSEGLVLNPASNVGVIWLPSGRTIRCEPKVAVDNIFFMLAKVLGFPSPFLPFHISFESVDELFDFVVDHFANLVDERLSRGLYRSYVEREGNLLTVRGRIAIAEDIRRNHVLRHRTYCQFTEFTWDVPENRIIRQTVHVVAQLVRRTDLRRRLNELDHQLGELDPAPLPLSVFDRFAYHRLNDDYEPIHRLCRLFLEGASVSEELGEFGFRAFLLDMNLLFERFVTVSLEDLARSPFGLRPQFGSSLDTEQRVGIKPDLMFTWRHVPAMPADCKYKRIKEGEFKNADLYQMLAYCTALGLPRGALIYPRNESELTGEVAVRNSDVRIRFFDVDLGLDHRDLPLEMERLFRSLIAWAAMPAEVDALVA